MAKQDQAVTVYEDESTGNRFVPYVTGRGVELDCLFDGEQPWFTQADLAKMFDVTVQNVNLHIQSFTADGELDTSTFKESLIVRQEGARQVKRQITHYGLDVAFYVGYRVNSTEGKLFRRWATTMLVQLATKGFVIHQRRLAGGENAERLRELRQIIADLRSQEANLYAEIRTICALCQDYDPKTDEARRFYQYMQAKIVYAITSLTPAQLIAKRVDARAENMGLQTWRGDRVQSADVTVGKNYLAQQEVTELNRVTSILLDVIEDQADIGKLTLMEQATELLDAQLAMLRRPVLKNPGPPKKDKADAHAKEQYRLFDARRREIEAERVGREILELKANTKELPVPPRPKRSTVAAMTKWFRANHASAENTPHNSEEGGYLYPLADIRDELEGEFPHASETAVSRAADELEAEGVWLSRAATEARQRDRDDEDR